MLQQLQIQEYPHPLACNVVCAPPMNTMTRRHIWLGIIQKGRPRSGGRGQVKVGVRAQKSQKADPIFQIKAVRESKAGHVQQEMHTKSFLWVIKEEEPIPIPQIIIPGKYLSYHETTTEPFKYGIVFHKILWSVSCLYSTWVGDKPGWTSY